MKPPPYTDIFKFLRNINMINWKQLAFTSSSCPVCSARRPIIRLHHHEMGIRCLGCRSSIVTMSVVSVLQQLVTDLATKDVYELSCRGPLFTFLKNKCGTLTCSEYFEGVAPGGYHNGILCQDVQQLTFADNSFDICTSTEVFEHVPNDLAGFAEIARVLKPGGLFLFTVPLFNSPTTLERARLNKNKEIEHILSPQYHGDPIRGHQPVLVFRDYGRDIQQRLLSQGFAHAELLKTRQTLPWGFSRLVVAGYL